MHTLSYGRRIGKPTAFVFYTAGGGNSSSTVQKVVQCSKRVSANTLTGKGETKRLTFSMGDVIKPSDGAGRIGCCEQVVNVFLALILGGRPRFPGVKGALLAIGRPGVIENTL